MRKQTQKDSLIHQTSLLMGSQIISGAIGLLYRTPLHKVMGDVGDGYYTYAFEWYAIILLISSYSIPGALSKLMADKIARKNEVEIRHTFIAALIYTLLAGMAGALVIFFGAPLLLSDQYAAVPALRALAPTVIASGCLGVFRGYFQAYGTMKVTAVSQIIEQAFNAVFSVLIAYWITRPYFGNEALTGKYGAIGGTTGTGIGVAAGLVFVMFCFFRKLRKTREMKYSRSGNVSRHALSDAFREMLKTVTPIILSTFVYHVSTVIDQTIFTRLILLKGFTALETSKMYALYGYRFVPVMNIPVGLASATATAIIPAISLALFDKNNQIRVCEKIRTSMRLTLFISIPAALGICVLSYPVVCTLYPGGNAAKSAAVLSAGAAAIIFYSLTTVMNGILQGIGRPEIPLRNTLAGLSVNIISLVVSTGLLNMKIYGLILSVILYSFTTTVLDLHAIYRHTGYRQGITDVLIYLKPACIMSILVGIIFWVPFNRYHSVFNRYLPRAALMLTAILLGMFFYLLLCKAAGTVPSEKKRDPA